jgi:hypothetical protein
MVVMRYTSYHDLNSAVLYAIEGFKRQSEYYAQFDLEEFRVVSMILVDVMSIFTTTPDAASLTILGVSNVNFEVCMESYNNLFQAATSAAWYRVFTASDGDLRDDALDLATGCEIYISIYLSFF